MIRLYADNAMGVILNYSVNRSLLNNGFLLKPVSYQREDQSHPELEIIRSFLHIKAGEYYVILNRLSIWQHFFKPYEYAFEEEVRLLYRLPVEVNNPNLIWNLNSEFNIITPIIGFEIDSITNKFPLTLTKITMGPKMREQAINQQQIQYLLFLKNIHNYAKIMVDSSPINHYR